ncbi:MAG: ATP-dependent 6-phosphofructokinase [Salinivirgaceae bacterium]|jgi:phosphofructokinase-like protein|nr:ATP-dependent 6-phosphofructokinase [Salinivirgaceae bacterium]
MANHIGLLTSGGDTPGLNAALRGVGKAAIKKYGSQIIGFKDGFRGLMENRIIRLDPKQLSGILTLGGTILGTSRDKPHKMPVGGKILDMTDVIVENYHKQHLDALVCLGGGGTQKNAYELVKKGLNIITLPKTIDNDVAYTDMTFGFDTALGIAVDAIDRLHSTAHSHHRIIVVEIMGNKAGWLALGAGVAGGADTILIPEIPYDINMVAESILSRARNGSPFSIVAVAEGAMSKEKYALLQKAISNLEKAEEKGDRQKWKAEIKSIKSGNSNNTMQVAQQLEAMTGLEARVTILGHLQRGGTPSAADRLLATRLGTACADFIKQGQFGVMVASKGDGAELVPLEKVAGVTKLVPLDHSWVDSARSVGTCLGDF